LLGLSEWFDHTTGIDRTATLRRALDLTSLEKRPMGCVITRRFWQILEDVKKKGKSWKETEMQRLWEERRDWRLFIH
jgi:hypothetical protein